MSSRYLVKCIVPVLLGAVGFVVSPSTAHGQSYIVAITSPAAGSNVVQNTGLLLVSGTVTPVGGITAPAYVMAGVMDPNLNTIATAYGGVGGAVPGSSPPQWQFSLGVMIGMTGFPSLGVYTLTVQPLNGAGQILPGGTSIYFNVVP
jgi:hypothetical protein